MSFSRGGSIFQPVNSFAYSEDSVKPSPKTPPTPASVKTLTRESSAPAATKNGKKPAEKKPAKSPKKPAEKKKKPAKPTSAGKKKPLKKPAAKKKNGSAKPWHILTPQ